MLLHLVRGPTSFIELKIVNGQECQTHREACEARRLLENDNHWDEIMEEAVQCRSPDKIRDLYATLLSSCGLWDKDKEYMADDILHQLQQVHTYMTFNEHIYKETLIIIENKVSTMVGKKLDDFGMQSPRRDNRDNFNNEIARELDYDSIAL
ncbi:ATP-dependent DNA helicase [Trichonephila clavipes]|nr:ATP-dependent DNA helicase [Trichonephila clavipes]